MKYGVNACQAMPYSGAPRPSAPCIDWLHDHRCHRISVISIAAPRHRGAAADQSRHSRALAERAGPAVLGLGYPTPYLGLFREDSSAASPHAAAQGVLKWPTSRPTLATPGRRIFPALPCAAVDRILYGSRAGNVRRSGRAAARGVAGAGAVRPGDGDHPNRRGV